MNINAALVANGSAVVLLIVLLWCTRHSTRNGLLERKLYYTMVWIVMMQAVLETVCFLIDGIDTNAMCMANKLANSLIFVNTTIFGFLWTLYADYKLFGNVRRLRKIYRYLGIPAVIMLILIMVNLFCPMIFEIRPGNIYQRGPLYPAVYIQCYIYLFYGVILIYLYRNKVDKYLFLPAVIFMMPIVLGSVLQYFLYGMALLWLGAAISLTSLYINVGSEVAYVDYLSGLYSRQYLERHIQVAIKTMKPGARIAGFMLDIDEFKIINDMHGHLMGDKAIEQAGKLLRSCTVDTDFVARYGGDEFMVIRECSGDRDAQDFLNALQKKCDEFNASRKQYRLEFSIGWDELRPDDTMDTFVQRMDQKMYAEKHRKNLTYRRRATDRPNNAP